MLRLATIPRASGRSPLLLRRLLSATAMVVLAACSTLAPKTEAPIADGADIAAAANPPPTVEPKPDRAPMPAPASLSHAPDLWQRFASGRHWQPCELTPGVDRWIKRYASKPSRFADTLAPVVPLMDYVLTQAEALGLPSEIMLVPIVESYYRADARGPGGALGMWQLMPDTGRRFGLVGRGTSDDRLDVHASTAAALQLLKINADTFSNNPKLMFAAYNAGAYRLRKALAGRDHASMNSLDGLGLARTTREYIDKIKALGCLIGEPERFSLQLPPLAEDARLVEFRAPYPVDPNAVVAQAGTPSNDLKRWNQRAFARTAADAKAPMLLPSLVFAAATHAVAEGALPKVAPKAPVSVPTVANAPGKVHRVASGDSLWTISKRYRVRLPDLMRWNGLNQRSVLRIGQTLHLQNNS